MTTCSNALNIPMKKASNPSTLALDFEPLTIMTTSTKERNIKTSEQQSLRKNMATFKVVNEERPRLMKDGDGRYSLPKISDDAPKAFGVVNEPLAEVSSFITAAYPILNHYESPKVEARFTFPCLKSNKRVKECLREQVFQKESKGESEIFDEIPLEISPRLRVNKLNNSNMISRWKYNDLISGKYSSGTTPKIARKDLRIYSKKLHDSDSDHKALQTTDFKTATIKSLPQEKKGTFKRVYQSYQTIDLNQEKKLHTLDKRLDNFEKSKLEIKTKPFSYEDKENISPNIQIEQIPEGEAYEDLKTPSPRKTNDQGFPDQIMSIKQERKIFDKFIDLIQCEDESESPSTFSFSAYNPTRSHETTFGKQKQIFCSAFKKKRNEEKIKVKCQSRFNADYEVLEHLGGGNFGCVYKCLNKFDNIVYAIKVTKNKIFGESTKSQALNEAHALATLSVGEENSHIVRYYNAWIEDNKLYLVMEYCQKSLRQIKENLMTLFSETEIRKILRDVSTALKLLHHNNIVHLDIKPENILFSCTEKYKLSDLGLSRIAKRSCGEEIDEGDSRYLSPELLLSFNQNGFLPDLTKADIYSLALSIYELLIGEELPANGQEWLDIRSGHIPKLDSLQNYSQGLKLMLKKMLSPQPENRPSAGELLDSELLQTEIEIELKWERQQNQIYKKKIEEYEKILSIKRKSSF